MMPSTNKQVARSMIRKQDLAGHDPLTAALEVTFRGSGDGIEKATLGLVEQVLMSDPAEPEQEPDTIAAELSPSGKKRVEDYRDDAYSVRANGGTAG